MDLVQLIHDQLSGDALGKLSSLLNTDAASTRKAASAAVPAVLSAVSSLAGSEDGIGKLVSTLGGIDPSHSEGFVHALAGDSGSLIQKGSGLLSSLFGDGLVGNIASTVGRFANLDGTAVKRLLASITPMILGVLAGRWKSQGGTPAALSNLLDDQEHNIAKAIPSGFSLASIPGLSSANEMFHAAGDTARGQAAPRQTQRAALSGRRKTRRARRSVGFCRWRRSYSLRWDYGLFSAPMLGPSPRMPRRRRARFTRCSNPSCRPCPTWQLSARTFQESLRPPRTR